MKVAHRRKSALIVTPARELAAHLHIPLKSDALADPFGLDDVDEGFWLPVLVAEPLPVPVVRPVVEGLAEVVVEVFVGFSRPDTLIALHLEFVLGVV